MSLAPGARLGPYEIVAPLGAGGMGEVWRARDPRLGREVAIKVLPEGVSGDPRALARFEREARAVAALSHPHILAVYDVGEAGGVRYTVTELLEGETLRALVRRGALPPSRALEIAGQVADALSAAHERGIVHGDVKPENVFLTRDGRARLLDFGLARAGVAPGSPAGATPEGDVPTAPAAAFGTLPYTSPEQAKGVATDHRGDQFALGVVLYEMLAGRRPFEASSRAETLAALLREEAAPLSRIAPRVPAPARWIVERCLSKDPERRWAVTRDLANDLAALRRHLDEDAGAGWPPAFGQARRDARRAVAPAVPLLLLGATVALLVGSRVVPPTAVAAARIGPFRRLTSLPGAELTPALSPDGRTAVFTRAASPGAATDVFSVRAGGFHVVALTAHEPGEDRAPAFSPDGQRIAFRSSRGGGGLYLMEATGESPRRLTEFGEDPDWFPDGARIVFATEAVTWPHSRSRESELWVVEVATGRPERLHAGDAVQPRVSPHGLRVAFWAVSEGSSRRDVFTVAAMPGHGRREAVPVTADPFTDWSPFWSADGRALYFASDRGGAMNLWRVAIDERTGVVLGPPEAATVPASEAGPFRASADGRKVVYQASERTYDLLRFPFDSRRAALGSRPAHVVRSARPFVRLRVSPSGDRVAYSTIGDEDLWVVATDGSGPRKLTDGPARDREPCFSPDGRSLVFYTDRFSESGLAVIDAEGGVPRPIPVGRAATVPVVSPDGRTISFEGWEGHVPLLLEWSSSGSAGAVRELPIPGPDLGFEVTDWSPDGQRLAGILKPSGFERKGIAVLDLRTLDFTVVSRTGRDPRFLADGRRLLYLDDSGLVLARPGSSGRTVLLPNEPDRLLQGFAALPGQESLVVAVSRFESDLWLADVEPSGGPGIGGASARSARPPGR